MREGEESNFSGIWTKVRRSLLCTSLHRTSLLHGKDGWVEKGPLMPFIWALTRVKVNYCPWPVLGRGRRPFITPRPAPPLVATAPAGASHYYTHKSHQSLIWFPKCYILGKSVTNMYFILSTLGGHSGPGPCANFFEGKITRIANNGSRDLKFCTVSGNYQAKLTVPLN